MKYIVSIIFLISSYVSFGQTYNPAQGTVSNKPYAPGQAVPTDSRSYFYDPVNFIWRPYRNTTEVLYYLNLSKYRVGHFSIYVNPTGTLNGNGTFTGGSIVEYWFKNGTANTDLVLKQDSTKISQSALNDTASSIRAVIPPQVNLIAGTNVTITGTYPNKTINASGGGGAVNITANNGTGARVTPSPITGSGVISNDTFTVGTRARIQKVIDSLDYYQDTLFVSNTVTPGVPLTYTNIDYDSIFIKRLVPGAGIILTQNNDSSVTASLDSATAANYASNTASNLGASGVSLYKQKIGVDLQFRKVIAGSNISISENTNDITITATTGGESNTASNVGSGNGVFKQKTGVDLEYKSLIGNAGVAITNNTNDLTFKVDTTSISTIAQMQKRLGDTSSVLRGLVSGEVNTASNLGATGSSWYKQKVGVDLQFRKVIGGTNVTVTQNADDITISSSAGGGESNTASNVGSGSGVFKQKTGIDLEYKSLIGGNGISLTNNTSDLTFKADTSVLSTINQMQKRLGDTAAQIRLMPVGEVNTGSNLGATGSRVFSSKVGTDLQFRRIIAGTNVTVNENTNDITISAASGGGGEVNTASNAGSGSGWYKQKTGINLEFKSVIANTGISATANADDVTLKADTSVLSTIAQMQKRLNDTAFSIRNMTVGESNTASNLGASGSSLYKQKVGVDLQFRKVIAGANVTVTENANDITISSALDGGENNTASNVGGGVGVFKQKTGVDLELKSLIEGNGILITNNTNDLTLKADTVVMSTNAKVMKIADSIGSVKQNNLSLTTTGSSGVATLTGSTLNIPNYTIGESNTASNVGSGSGWYKQKTGINLEYKSVVAGSGMVLNNNTDDITLKVDTSTISTIAQMQKRVNDSMFVTRNLFSGSGVYAAKGSLTAASGYDFCYVKGVGGSFEISNKVLKVGHASNDDQRTITVNSMVYVSSFSTGGWVHVATIPSGYRPSGMVVFPISDAIPGVGNPATTPIRASDGTTGITDGCVYTGSSGYIDPDTGFVYVRLQTITSYATLSGGSVVVFPIVVTYFINVGS